MTPDELRAIRERAEAATPGEWKGLDVSLFYQEGWLANGPIAMSYEAAKSDAAFIAHARTDVPALLDEVERLHAILGAGGVTYSEGETALRAQLAEAHATAKQLMEERDEARDVILEYSTALAERHAENIHLTNERDEARAIANAAVREVSESFLKCKEWLAADAEQARSYGLTYQGIRKMVHDYMFEEISFGKLVDLIRGAAKAMAEDQVSSNPKEFT